MRSALKILVVFLILMVTFGLPIILQQVINPQGKNTVQTTPTPPVEEIDDIRFISVPPILVSAKSTFVYKILVASLSGNEVTLSILAKPDWVQWDPNTSQFTGTVPDIGGVFTITLRAATIAGDVQDQTFTVTIDKLEDVKGAKTIGMWKDPFHPNVQDIQAREQPILPDVTTEDTSIPEEILGEKTTTTAKDFLNDTQQNYVLVILIVVLLAVISSIVVRMWKVFAASRSKLPAGVIIERGGR